MMRDFDDQEETLKESDSESYSEPREFRMVKASIKPSQEDVEKHGMPHSIQIMVPVLRHESGGGKEA